MCCDPEGPYPGSVVGECPDCGCDVDEDGVNCEQNCRYSPVECTTCGWRPCDLSC